MIRIFPKTWSLRSFVRLYTFKIFCKDKFKNFRVIPRSQFSLLALVEKSLGGSLGGSGLKFCKEDLNMATINFSLLQNMKWLSIKQNYTKHLTEVVFGNFIWCNKVFYFKTGLESLCEIGPRGLRRWGWNGYLGLVHFMHELLIHEVH